MKKNRMMRLASMLLVAVLVTTTTISGTYAKYVTTAEGEDYARVAKWGVKITANGALFEKKYAKNDGTYTKGDDTVESSNEWKVVAPGTTKAMTEVVVEGTPEVATRFSYEVKELELINWTLEDSSEYFPVIFTIEGQTFGIDGLGNTLDNSYADIAALKAGITDYINNYKQDFAPNTTLDDVAVKDKYLSVSWSWPFETGADDAAKAANDIKDTELGDLAAAGRDTIIKLKVATTVTQID